MTLCSCYYELSYERLAKRYHYDVHNKPGFSLQRLCSPPTYEMVTRTPSTFRMNHAFGRGRGLDMRHC